MVRKIARVKKYLNRIKNFFGVDKIILKRKLKEKNIIILTRWHTVFLAKLLEKKFQEVGFRVEVEILEGDKQGFEINKQLHIVICPQAFKNLPHYYIAYQMEQLRESHWWTKQYQNILRNSLAIFDYTQSNIDFMLEEGFLQKKLVYLPLSINLDYQKHLLRDFARDGVIFYGHIGESDRRKTALGALTSIPINIITNSFGDKLYCEILKSKIVLNIHYYNDALLETTRIYESLSLGAIVVSEESKNMDEYPDLKEKVVFFKSGNYKQLLEILEKLLVDKSEYNEHLNKILESKEDRTRVEIKQFLRRYE